MKSAPVIARSLLMAWLIAGLLTGCVAVVPVPPSHHQPTYGKVITREMVCFIVPGRTTRGEVVAHLGDHYRDSPRLPVLAYAWEKPACGLMWWIVLAGPGGAGAGGGHSEASDWRAFFVKFDAQGRVADTKFASLSGRRSLDEQMEDWAVGKTQHFADFGSHLFNPDSGVPQFLEYMKKTGHFEAGP